MEVILFIAILYGGFVLIGWIFSKISDANERHKKKVRDQVATEILNGLDVDNLVASYKQKLAHIRYSKVDLTNIEIERMREQLWGRNTVLMKECPECKNGQVIVRKGRYGKFMACTYHPRCNYTIKIETARAEYKKSVNEQFVDDMRKAYSKV
jgi:hypothetical protein